MWPRITTNMNYNPLNYCPFCHIQLSADGKCDAEACISYGRVDCVVPLCKLYGDNTDYNPEYLAETSHTTISGNTVFNVDLAYYQDGLVSSTVLPYLTTFTWSQLYNRDLTKIIPIGRKFWDRYDPVKSTVTAIDPSKAVEISQQATFDNPYTVQVIVDMLDGKGNLNGQPVFLYHSQALLSGKIWDSYNPNLKSLTHPIKWAYIIKLVPKNMSNVKLVKNGGEYGFYLPATNEQSMIDKANNFGYPLPVVNGTAVDWPNVKPDITIN